MSTVEILVELADAFDVFQDTLALLEAHPTNPDVHALVDAARADLSAKFDAAALNTEGVSA